METTLQNSAKKVQEALNTFGIGLEVVEFSASTRTAQQAADAIGCTVGQIAKSLVFKGAHSEKPYLVIASGTNRVNEKLMEKHLGEPLAKADASFVLEHTGFAIGGVPPVGHRVAIATYIDEDLLGYSEIWAAAGTPFAVFKLLPADLVTITNGTVVKVV